MKVSHLPFAGFVLGFFALTISSTVMRPRAVAAPEHPAATPPRVHFVDISGRAGLTARTEDGGEKTKKYIIETTGIGAAFFDYDNDGWPDIFLVNGTTLEGFPKGKEPTSHLYHNNRDGTFTDVTQQAHVAVTGWGQGVCAGDYDNDGWVDLFITFWGHNVLLHNNGDGTFTDVTKQSGLWHDDVRWGTGCAFIDYDRDGRLDLFVSQYIDFDLAKTPIPGQSNYCRWKGIPVMCGPRGLKGTTSELYHNNGDGTFTDVSEKSGVAKTGPYYCLTALTGDFDNDGWPDIYVACDSTPSMLFHNNHDGTFSEIGVGAGVAYNGDGHDQAGMGADAADYVGDGWLDIIKTNFSDQTASLYRNNHDETFTDATYEAGLGGNTQFLGWGTLFVDVDNDGWADLFMANGHVYPELDAHNVGSTFRERKLLYWNRHDGRFKDISLDAGPGITKPFNSHGVAAADFDNDGMVEILVNNSHDPPSLLKNYGNHGNWVMIKLLGTKSNRDAIGAQVRVRTNGHQQLQEVRSGGSYISQSDFRLHFGLGSARKVDQLEIRWPSGFVEKLEDVPANQVLTVKEGVGMVKHQCPARRWQTESSADWSHIYVSIVFKGGTVIDGTGAPPALGDVLISGQTVETVGVFEAPADAQVIDCRGLAVAPGFIDSHSHLDLQVLETRSEKLAQGVTTEVVGNCGFSPYPVPAEPKLLHDFANGLFCGGTDWGWPSARAYLEQAARSPTTTVFSLVGHGSLRIARVGHQLGQLAERDLDWMEQTLAESLAEGACGFSTGLMYSPGASAPFAELERLCRVVARHQKTYATHMRGYGDHLIEAVDEQLELARRTGCRLQISHFQAVGPRNWDKQAVALEKIERATAEGLDVGFDCYPYVAGSTVLTQLLPQSALAGGIDGLLARLSDRTERKRIAAETDSSLEQGWTNILIAALETPDNRGLIGQPIAAIATSRRCEPVEVVFDLIAEEKGRVNMLEMNQSEANLRRSISHPLSCIISDGFYVKGRPHPRLYGTFPLLLGEISRERGWLTLAAAVYKITEKPARRFSIPRRGRLEPGHFADVVVFDPAEVNSLASFQTPSLPPTGICHVFRNGVLVWPRNFLG